MAKYMRVTDEIFTEKMNEIRAFVTKEKTLDGKITLDIGKVDKKAELTFSEPAWEKIHALVKSCDKEVGWHGIAHRDGRFKYYVEDIIVYPQEVTGTTVTPDQKKYEEWLMSFDDEVFDNIRFQAHSHVNMGTTPSSVDTNFYKGIINQLGSDMFYIFMIFNKKGERYVIIYDNKENLIFEKNDVTIYVEDGDMVTFDSLTDDEKEDALEYIKTQRIKVYTDAFVEENKAKVEDKKYTYSASSTKSSYGSWYNYNGGYDDEDFFSNFRK